MVSCDALFYDRFRDHLLRKIRRYQYAIDYLNPKPRTAVRLGNDIDATTKVLARLKI